MIDFSEKQEILNSFISSDDVDDIVSLFICFGKVAPESKDIEKLIEFAQNGTRHGAAVGLGRINSDGARSALRELEITINQTFN